MKKILKTFVLLGTIIFIQNKVKAMDENDVKKVPFILYQALLDSSNIDVRLETSGNKEQELKDIISKAKEKVSNTIDNAASPQNKKSENQKILIFALENEDLIINYLNKNENTPEAMTTIILDTYKFLEGVNG